MTQTRRYGTYIRTPEFRAKWRAIRIRGKYKPCAVCPTVVYWPRYDEKVRRFKTCSKACLSILFTKMRSGKSIAISQENRERSAQRRRLWNTQVWAGSKHNIQARFKIGSSRRGSKNYSWKGGIYPENHAIRHSIPYRLWREAVFKRDNFTCVFCKAKSCAGNPVIIQADHIKSFADYPGLRFKLSNGRTLCLPCHRKTPTYGTHKKNGKNIKQVPVKVIVSG